MSRGTGAPSTAAPSREPNRESPGFTSSRTARRLVQGYPFVAMSLEDEGYELQTSGLAPSELDVLAAALPTVERGGVRSLLEVPEVQHIARRLRALAGEHFFAVRALLFDKGLESNWALGWHQDSSVAVVERREVDGFGSWTVKGGVTHAIAPARLLERMVTLRLHLDACGAEAGPLRVVVGSHREGRLDDAGIARAVDRLPEHTCHAARGDVLIFKPLLIHASSSATASLRRRVLQLELSADALPGGLAWRWRV